MGCHQTWVTKVKSDNMISHNIPPNPHRFPGQDQADQLREAGTGAVTPAFLLSWMGTRPDMGTKWGQNALSKIFEIFLIACESARGLGAEGRS